MEEEEEEEVRVHVPLPSIANGAITWPLLSRYLAVTESLLGRDLEFRSRIMRSMRSEPLITSSAGTPVLTTDSRDVTALHQAPVRDSLSVWHSSVCVCVCVCVRARARLESENCCGNVCVSARV